MSGFVRQIYKSLLPYETRLWLYKLRHNKEYEQLRTAVHPSDKGDFSLKPFDEHQCIFVHITKTAGTSVAKSLFGYLPYHYTAIDYRIIYGKRTFDRYFKFAFVRNPWDRLYSAYRYLKAGGWNNDDKTWASQHLGPYNSFEGFVKKWLNEDNIKLHRHFWPQYMFICDDSFQILVDHIAYFETINDDFDFIRSKIKINTTLGQHNVNPGQSYTNAYTDETRNIVEQVYTQDIKMFGYDFAGINKRRQASNNT